jgi:hypothetical protein
VQHQEKGNTGTGQHKALEYTRLSGTGYHQILGSTRYRIASDTQHQVLNITPTPLPKVLDALGKQATNSREKKIGQHQAMDNSRYWTKRNTGYHRAL